MIATSRRPSGRKRTWLVTHKERLAYLLIAVSIVVVVGAGTAAGVLLRRAADLERQTLRTQQLASSAFQLQSFLLRAEAAKGVSSRLAAGRKQALVSSAAELARVRANDRREGDRIQAAWDAYIRDSTSAFLRVAADRGPVPAAMQRRVQDELSRLESEIDAEIGRQGRAAQVKNPEARAVLVTAVLVAALLVGLLIWQFQMQRRAGRIDRDHAERSDELIRRRDEFVSAVSHELRTPLTSILGYLDLIRDNESENLTPEQEAFLGTVQRNADRLLRLVSDLLLVAQVDGGPLALELQDLDLMAVAADCVEAAGPAAEAKQIRLTLSHGSPVRLEGDPLRLAQLVDNLVSNAIKFTPPGGHVTVTAAVRGEQALFEVSDSGPGISPADHARLFDRFFRTRAATAEAIQGTGLGLTIAKAIVDAHYGSIAVESALGAGATFRVLIPQTQAPASQVPSQSHAGLG